MTSVIIYVSESLVVYFDCGICSVNVCSTFYLLGSVEYREIQKSCNPYYCQIWLIEKCIIFIQLYTCCIIGTWQACYVEYVTFHF